jgi:hypothetical protein
MLEKSVRDIKRKKNAFTDFFVSFADLHSTDWRNPFIIAVRIVFVKILLRVGD